MELLLIIVVIGVVGAIVAPKFRQRVYQSREAATKGNLGLLRGAIAIYYSDNFGIFPSDAGTPETRLSSILVPHYIKEMPKVRLKHIYPQELNTVQDRFDNRGDWWYTMHQGFVAVNSSHTDTKSTSISNW
jgi:type II secretory pathway pseudopilin PulG